MVSIELPGVVSAGASTTTSSVAGVRTRGTVGSVAAQATSKTVDAIRLSGWKRLVLPGGVGMLGDPEKLPGVTPEPSRFAEGPAFAILYS